MRILIRTSKTAIWARRLGSLAVPLVVLPVGMHHLKLIDSPSFFIVALGAMALAAIAILVSLLALVRLWYSGDQGWGSALLGLLFGLFSMAPFTYYGYLAATYPPVTDIATVPRGELPLLFLPDTAQMPPPKLLSAEEQARVFPNATTRTYPLDPTQLFAIVTRLADAEGWDIRLSRDPGADGTPGRINARIVTIPGWTEEAVIRVSTRTGGSSVDMRSASINAPHDFGSNGTRIENFMIALDNEVTTLLRDNPTANQPAPAEDEEPAPAVEGQAQ
ncbi:hypothetical protein VW35_17995 [Devosia soli]|uniref:DUF1499 domain-containing protein n=1 Tax=Devosia soli TaxID=361041 RepID=A0A0F5L4V6_9HYPH|nr:DUF1499 domain-containing protein [Devosia soli]KKB76652.1 hypothetical protein VW35_17995 [Devosia soli]